MKIATAVKEQRSNEVLRPVENFMGGTSFEFSPLETLKMVTASSIFGEPSYYRDGEFKKSGLASTYEIDPCFSLYSVLPEDKFAGKTTTQIMEEVIDDALSYDFGATLNWAIQLRRYYNMRLNPQVIMVRAAIHPGRVAFTKEHPLDFADINFKVMQRADEPASQAAYYIYKNGSKSKIPNILKRSWKRKIEKMSRYDLAKYKSSGLGIINVSRLCHASSNKNSALDELMKTGTIAVDSELSTWERERSAGKSWAKILTSKTYIPHMALLRNLRGIFKEIDNYVVAKIVTEQLLLGVEKGKQFPFRYWSAYKAIDACPDVHHKQMLLDCLSECIDQSRSNMPVLKGKTICLSDNSGSAWGAIPSEYGSVTVAEIGNLSSLITAANSDEGYIGIFGDRLKTISVSKKDSLLSQLRNACEVGSKIGGATENGIWLFFKNAIENHEVWDNIFIYSDQQAGHGELYGNAISREEYGSLGFAAPMKRVGSSKSRYIDVSKLVAKYRIEVNQKVNVFSVQTAGYTNAVIPEYGYRTNLLYGWTGKELVFAHEMIKFWDEKDEDRKWCNE